MDKRKREKFKKLLLEERRRILEEIENLKNDSSSEQRELSGELSGYAYHLADVATDSYNREFNLDLASNEEKVLYEISNALKMVETKEYGKCEKCAKKINNERLETIPYTRFCIKCQEEEEKKQ